MSARIVAVRRPRSPVFGLLWAGAGFVRSFVASLVAESGPSRRDVQQGAAFVAGARSAPDPCAPMPWLVWADTGTHLCVGCGRCIVVCPSDALSLERSGTGCDVASVHRFELDPGRCIGCGLCVESCPEHALGMAEGAERVGEGTQARRRSIVDLLKVDLLKADLPKAEA